MPIGVAEMAMKCLRISEEESFSVGRVFVLIRDLKLETNTH